MLVGAGRDAMHNQHLGTGAQPAAFNYICLCGNTTPPVAGNTNGGQIGEITTAGGGLLRGQATFAHTFNTNSSSLTKTFTANASDSLPVNVGKIGVFNAASSGTLGYETLISTGSTPFSTVGDNMVLTHTVTAG